MRRTLAIATILTALTGLSAPALAITAGDVVDKMSREEQIKYVSGAIDMAMWQFVQQGRGDRAECVLEWFYHDEESAREVVNVYYNYKDKPAIPLLYVLINRHCKE